MPNIFSSKEIKSVLEKLGFKFNSQKESYGKFKDLRGNIAIVPLNKKKLLKALLEVF